MTDHPAATGPVPRVSVLMTTYNGARFIGESIASVLAQTLPDFELVIVDDTSTDETPSLLAGYADPRLRVLRPDRNLGVAEARNFGLTACRGTYVAALDHDDISLPQRLAVQVRYLDAHPDIVLVGTEVLLRMQDGRTLPTDHMPGSSPGLMHWMLHVDNPFTWSSVMLRAAALRRPGTFMRRAAEPADDFDLYHRLMRAGALARLDEALTIYRWHAANTSYGQSERLFASACATLARAYEPLLGAASADAARLVVHHLSDRQPVRDIATLARLGTVMERLLIGFQGIYAADAAALRQIEAHAGRVWWRVVRSAVRSGTPYAITRHAACSRLRSGFSPLWHDMAVSVGVGAVRATRMVR